MNPNRDNPETPDPEETVAHGDSQDPVMAVVEVEGVCLPRIFETTRPLTQHVQLLRSLDMRDDDVIVAAYTKSGTHWIWEIVTMLISGKAEYEKRIKECVMMEAVSMETLQSEPSPRVFNTHLPFRLLPRQIWEKRVKVIHVYRNVKDVFVSVYFHFRQIPGAENLTLGDLEKEFFSEAFPTGNYFTYLKQMDDFMKSNTEVPFFCTSYEDMKEDPVRVIQNVARFLEVKVSAQLCEDIAQATGFARLKEADLHKQLSHIPFISMYRKGEVGDWKNYLTVAQSERFDAAMTQLTSCDFRFRYTL